MAYAAKIVEQGYLPNSQAAILTPGAAVWYVSGLAVFNDNAATQTILLYLKKSGGTARKWRRIVLEQNEHADVLDGHKALNLGAGDTLEAVTTTASAVTFTAWGVEQT